MIDAIFYLCVALLIKIAELLGTTYEAVNVWIFCFLWPIGTVSLCVVAFQRGQRIKELEQDLTELKARIAVANRANLRTISPQVRNWRCRKF